MFRSEKMALCQMFLQSDAAYSSVSEFGETGLVQFRDLNSEVNVFQRKFVNEVRRCDEMERQINYIESELNKDKIPIPDLSNELPRAPNPREIIDLEAHLEKTENEILELSQNGKILKQNFLELTELKNVLEKTYSIFTAQNAIGIDSVRESQTEERLGFVAGIIQRERVPAFELMLWRISRGNIFLYQVELEETLEDPITENHLNKTVFVIFFQGEQIGARVKKICTGFRASLYPCPSELSERSEMAQNVRTRLQDLSLVLNKSKDFRERVLVNVAKEVQNWSIMVRKMKAIYHTLNLFNIDLTKNCLIAECWIPVLNLSTVQKILSNSSASVGSAIPSFLNVIEASEMPPTFNRTNKFTRGFQNLIDAYGVASYREANPALYTIITFPFLFAIMFGDLGHGLIMFLLAFWMVGWEKSLGAKKSNNEIWNIFFGGRYIILLMGIFSMYTGIIYNDLFSKSIKIFSSGWSVTYNESTVMENLVLVLNPEENYSKSVYPLGMDPIWQLAQNKIIFLNSFKMKLSIIFGVVHMIFGVCMSVVNHNHFRKRINILLEFLPQVIFLVLLFAYMVFMMFFKWVIYGATNPDLVYQPACAPSVLILFINMLLFKSTTPAEGCKEYMFEGQQLVQQIFVVISLLCIPWLLLAKPIYISTTRKNKDKTAIIDGHTNEALDNVSESKETKLQQVHGHDQEPMSEIYIQQAIHTIEYILSTISHTASYLRLWALSLAHSQLSDVLWNRILKFAFILPLGPYLGPIFIFIIFIPWTFLTVSILVCMEGLSAFLHTLRLHWVEFMSKFYEGHGYAFEPFSFNEIMDGGDELPQK